MSKSTRLLLKNTPKEILAVSFSDTQHCRKVLSMLPSDRPIPAYTIWLTQIEQIHRFVRSIPNLAWELMDYATEPLTLIYSQAKPLFPDLDHPNEIGVRLIDQDYLRKVLSPHAWLAVETDMLPSEFFHVDWVEREIDMKGKLQNPRPVKMIRVFDNGEFSFVVNK